MPTTIMSNTFQGWRKKAAAVRVELGQDLDHEHGEDRLVGGDERRAGERHDARRGFQAEDHGVDGDEDEDQPLHARRLDPFADAAAQGRERSGRRSHGGGGL
jgi:hypothetical protein